MNALRRGALAVGLVLVGGGLAVVVAPDLAAGLNPSSVLVSAIGVLALLTGLAGVRARLGTEFSRADLPDPERRVATTVPGSDADENLATLSARTRYRLMTGHSLRRRVRAAAIDVLVAEGYTETDAEAALAEGTWTDDPYAAAFFTGESAALPLWVRARDALGGEPGARVQARHAIDALADRSGATGTTDTDGRLGRAEDDRDDTTDGEAGDPPTGDGDTTTGEATGSDTGDATASTPFGDREGAS